MRILQARPFFCCCAASDSSHGVHAPRCEMQRATSRVASEALALQSIRLPGSVGRRAPRGKWVARVKWRTTFQGRRDASLKSGRCKVGCAKVLAARPATRLAATTDPPRFKPPRPCCRSAQAVADTWPQGTTFARRRVRSLETAHSAQSTAAAPPRAREIGARVSVPSAAHSNPTSIAHRNPHDLEALCSTKFGGLARGKRR